MLNTSEKCRFLKFALSSQLNFYVLGFYELYRTFILVW